jgi:hypothetical protein
MSNTASVNVVPIVECLAGEHVQQIVDGLAGWKTIASTAVVIVPPGRARSFYAALEDNTFALGIRIVPGFKVRREYADLWSPNEWRLRAREDCETIAADLWTDAAFDSQSVRVALSWLGRSAIVSHWLALTHPSPRMAQLHAAMDAVSKNRYVFSEAGRWGWNGASSEEDISTTAGSGLLATQQWATYVLSAANAIGERIEWMLWPQSVEKNMVPQPHAPSGNLSRMYTSGEALEVAKMLGGQVLMYPGLGKLESVGKEMTEAAGKLEAGALL